jgi:4-hydroxybutyrate CoA-transferase
VFLLVCLAAFTASFVVQTGSARLYDLARDKAFAFRNVAHTHGLSVLASMDNLVSINSALEVDLLGQVNVETIGGRQISGVGRALDFARGAAASRNGRHLVTLASITASGRSRIVTRLSRETPVAYTRHDLGIVVTEHGSADLRGLSTNERAKAPVAVRDRRSVRAGEPEPRVGGDSERTARPVARRA